MSRLPWLHADELPPAGELVLLDADEARHGARAQRLRPGDAVVLTDGCGATARSELVDAGRRELRARVIERTEHPREAPPIHLASALPKGDRIATLLAMATQLGITSFTPLHCERSVVVPSEGPHDRWTRVLRENAKQSQRPWLPEIAAPSTPHRVVPRDGGAAAWLLDPNADEALGVAPLEPACAQWLLVGPEGGFSDGERRAMTLAGARPCTLGGGILRIETAAVAGAAVLQARLAG